MGDIVIKIGDYVTRISYNNDIIFKVIDIKDNNYFLVGAYLRLSADSPIDDLKLYDGNINDDNFKIDFSDYSNLDRNDFFYLPGKILHIDGDEEFLRRSLEFYKKNRIKAYGLFLNESDLNDNLYDYLVKYNPDILVITGHDAYYKRKGSTDNVMNYKNTSNFIDAVKVARNYEKNQDKLIIIAGACQSNYEELIKAGSTFASSPKRINIHALDPAIIAGSLAFSDKNENIDLIKILEKTKYGSDGIGGIITKGTMYVGFPRE